MSKGQSSESGVPDAEVDETTKVEELYRQNGQVGYRLHITLKADAAPSTNVA